VVSSGQSSKIDESRLLRNQSGGAKGTGPGVSRKIARLRHFVILSSMTILFLRAFDLPKYFKEELGDSFRDTLIKRTLSSEETQKITDRNRCSHN